MKKMNKSTIVIICKILIILEIIKEGKSNILCENSTEYFDLNTFKCVKCQDGYIRNPDKINECIEVDTSTYNITTMQCLSTGYYSYFNDTSNQIECKQPLVLSNDGNSFSYQSDKTVAVANADVIRHLNCINEKSDPDLECYQKCLNILTLGRFDSSNQAYSIVKSFFIDNSSINFLDKYTGTDTAYKELLNHIQKAFDNKTYSFGLYFEPTGDSVKEYIKNSQNADFKTYQVAFKDGDKRENRNFNFHLATWDFEGNFLGMNELADQLNLCNSTYESSHTFETFGTNMDYSCNLNLSKFVNKTDYQTKFYELFIKTSDDKYIDVPVIIMNFMEGRKLISEFDSDKIKTWNIVRRFYVMDNVSGHSSGSYWDINGVPLYLTYASKIVLHVHLKTFNDDTNQRSYIYLPYLEINYNEFKISSTSTTAKVQFKTQYLMDQKNFKRVIITVFIIVLILIFIAVALRMYVWTKLNPQILSPDNYLCWAIFEAIMKMFKFAGFFIFFLSFGISAYVYVFYKIQFNAFYSLPEGGRKKPFYWNFFSLWIVGAVFYIVYMFYRIFQQTSYDVFFIDWEHDKEVLADKMNNVRSEKYKGAWRCIHLANQFNELQKESTIDYDFCFLILLFLLHFQDTYWFRYFKEYPNYNGYEHTSPDNYILRYFIITFVLFVSGFAQYSYRRIIQGCYPMRSTEFLDLCSVSNISVFILDQSLHGYYLHGQNPIGKSDANLEDLVKFLEIEGKGKIKSRGLTDDPKDDLQSYEVYLSYSMRSIYDGLYYIMANNIINEGFNSDKLANQSRMPTIFKYIPSSLNVENAFTLNNFMNNELKNKIDSVSAQASSSIRDKTKLQRFLEVPPDIDLISTTAKEMMLYRDPGENFHDVLFFGMEIEWLIMLIYWYHLWYATLEFKSSPFYISIFMTYICHKILLICRMFFAEKNIAKKAFIDNRFFS